MKPHPRLLASATSASRSGGALRPEPMALLPPIPLYRRLLRAHRRLPPEMRLLGDNYVKAEFRAHRTVDNPAHLVRCLSLFFAHTPVCEFCVNFVVRADLRGW